MAPIFSRSPRPLVELTKVFGRIEAGEVCAWERLRGFKDGCIFVSLSDRGSF
jgi:hypothetical protein